MGPRLGRHPTLRLALNAVVADGRGGIQSGGDVRLAGRGEVAGIRTVTGPRAGQAVGLELCLHGRTPWPRRAGATRRKPAKEILHVVSVFVGHHVALGEGAPAGPKACLQLTEEV